MRSLRARLLAWVLLPLACTVAIDAWVAYRNAQATASQVQDQLLMGSARSIAEQIRFEDGSFVNQIPPSALELFQSTQPDRIYYRVTTGTGRLLAGYSDLRPPDPVVPADVPYFFNTVMRGSPVRAVTLFQPVIGDPSAKPVMVQVAQTLYAHQRLVSALWRNAVLVHVVILLLAGALILFGLQRGLRPLLQLRDRVNAREPGALTPLPTDAIPAELEPLVASLNDYVRRLEAHVGAQSVFIQNAAHQLRTPFALLNTQLSFAVRASGEVERVESVGAAYRTLQQAIRLVHQLLTLSTAQSLAHASGRAAAADARLAPLVQEVFEQLAVQAQSKAISLGFDTSADVPGVRAEPWMVREILMNLVDNAIRYTPSGGAVTVRLEREAGSTVLVVEDTGEGIAPCHRDRVFERFYRVHNTDSNGSGLGLAIVRELTSQIGATVTLTDSAGESGLAVHLKFAAEA